MSVESANHLSVMLNEQTVETQNTMLQSFLAEHGWQQGRFVVVVNNNVIPKSNHPDYQLTTGDRIEVLSPISGG